MRSRVIKFSVITILFFCGFCLTASVTSSQGADNPAELEASSAPNSPRTPLPAPFSESLFTFQQIEQQKLDLKERIVRVEISKVLGEGDDRGNNLLRFIAKDTSKSATLMARWHSRAML